MKNKFLIVLVAVFAFVQVIAQTAATTDENTLTVINPMQLPSMAEQDFITGEQEDEPVISIESQESKPQINCKMNERTMETNCKENMSIQNNSNQQKVCNKCVH